MRGYLKAWKVNAVGLVVVLVAVGMTAALVAAFRGKGGRPGSGDNASVVAVSITGNAPNGVAVLWAEDAGSSVLAKTAKLPYRKTEPVDGSSYYRVQAQPVGGGYSVTCTIQIGVVSSTHSAAHGQACTAAVDRNPAAPGWHGA